MNPKPDIWDYITEEWIHKWPLYMDMFRRKRFFSCILPTATGVQTARTGRSKYDTISAWQIPGILHSWQEYLY